MENLKNWEKCENNGEVYYYLPEPKDHVQFLELPKNVDDEILKLFSDKVNQVGRIGQFNESIIPVWSRSDKNDDLCELPYGCYRYQWGNGNLPNRLVSMRIRNDAYFVNQKLQNTVREDIQKFLDSKQIFDDLHVIYKRGILLYGEPGTGKSSFIRHAISEGMSKEYHAIWVDSIPSINFMHKFNALPTFKIFVIEEITTFNDSACDTKEMLEFLDGESSPQNSIIIATTNYPQELKKNMADRPSRFDLVLEIKESSEEEASMFFESFLKRKLTDGEVTLTGLCVAHIKDICLTSLMYNLPLQECYDRVMERRKNFKKGFSDRDEVGFSRGNSVPNHR
jgi:hypothetical protein